MLEIPEAVKRMQHDVEGIQQLLPVRTSLIGLLDSLVDLCDVLGNQNQHNDQRQNTNQQEQEVIRHEFLSDILIRGRPVESIVCSLEVFKGFLEFTVTVHSLTDTDVSCVEVGVSLEHVGPEVDRRGVILAVLCCDRIQKHVAVLGALKYRNALLILVQDQHCVALVADCLDAGDVTQQVSTLVTKREQKVTVKVVGVDSATLFVDDRPGLLGTACNVDQTGDACRNILTCVSGLGGVVNFTGRRIEAVTAHDLGTCLVEQLNGSILTVLGLAADGACYGAFVNGGGGYVNEVTVERDVVILGCHVGLGVLSLLIGLESSPDDLPCGDGYCLCADKSGESTVAGHYDDTLVGGGGYNVKSFVLINCDCNRLINRVVIKQRAFRLLDHAVERAVSVEYYDTVCIGIADPDVLRGYEHTLRAGEAVHNALTVTEGGDDELELVVTVQHNDTVVRSVCDVNVLLIVTDHVTGVVEVEIEAHVCGVDGLLGGVSIRRIQSVSVDGVRVGLICGACRSRQNCTGSDHNESEHYTYNSCKLFHDSYLLF